MPAGHALSLLSLLHKAGHIGGQTVVGQMPNHWRVLDVLSLEYSMRRVVCRVRNVQNVQCVVCNLRGGTVYNFSQCALCKVGIVQCTK